MRASAQLARAGAFVFFAVQGRLQLFLSLMVEFFVSTQGFGSQLPELVRAPDNINFFGFSHAHSPFSFDKLLIGAAFLTRAIGAARCRSTWRDPGGYGQLSAVTFDPILPNPGIRKRPQYRDAPGPFTSGGLWGLKTGSQRRTHYGRDRS